jgi:hypothetical protein
MAWRMLGPREQPKTGKNFGLRDRRHIAGDGPSSPQRVHDEIGVPGQGSAAFADRPDDVAQDGFDTTLHNGVPRPPRR